MAAARRCIGMAGESRPTSGICLVTVPSTFRSPDEAAIYYVVRRGSVVLRAGDKPLLRLRRGDAAVVSPGTTYELSPVMAGEVASVLVGSIADRSSLDVIGGASPDLITPLTTRDRRLAPWLRDLVLAVEVPPDVAPALFEAIGQLLVSRLKQTAHGELRGWSVPGIRVAVDAIRDDPAAAWTVGGLARVSAMSRSAFAEHFARDVGEPPMHFLTRCRMDRACELLRDPGLAIKQVARIVGYRSESAFSTAFRRVVGDSPRHYRRERFHADDAAFSA
jgi:AraC-like DNA-binding protein